MRPRSEAAVSEGRPLPLAARLALATLPARFRREFGPGIEELGRRRLATARGRARRAAITLGLIADLLRTAAAERLSSSYRAAPLTPSPRRHDRRGSPMTDLLRDLRYALRSALRRPGWSALVVLTLAVGIGASTAIFTVVDGVLLEPLPYDEPDELLRVYGRFDPESGFDFPTFDLSGPELVDYRRDARTVEDVAAFRIGGVTVTAPGVDPERIQAGVVTSNLLRLLRVEPILGRGFSEEEGRPGGASVALVSHGLWLERYSGEDVLGRTIEISGRDHAIVGVLPRHLDFPDPKVRLWLPLQIDEANPGSRQGHGLSAVARIAPGSDLEAVRSELEVMMASWKQRFPEIHTGHYLIVVPLLEDLVGAARPALSILLACSVLVLLIVCANVASLMLARSEDRGRDVALRAALGAGRSRLLRHLVLDGLVLAICGGALGVLLSQIVVAALLRAHAGSIPRAHQIGADASVLLFAVAATVATALLFSLAPAFQLGAAPQRRLIESTRGGTESVRRVLLRRVLVAAETALCFVLVLGAGLLVRSFRELMAVDPGFRTEGLLLANVSLASAEYPEAEQVTAFARRLAERADALPAADSASVSGYTPLYSSFGVWDFELEGKSERVDSDWAYNARFAAVDHGYLETLGVPLLGGRSFTAADRAGAEPVAMVNAEFVRRFLPRDEPLEKRIRVATPDDANPWARIVGVVGDERSQGLDEEAPPVYYFVFDQTSQTLRQPLRYLTVAIRTGRDPSALVGPLRAGLAELDPRLPLIQPQTMSETIANSTGRQRFTTVLLELFAVVALALGASGIHGVLACSVARRTRELGIRSTLGALPRELLELVLAQGLAPVLVGLAAGAVASIYLSRYVSSLLFGVTATDPWTWAAVVGLLLLVALLACVAPARRAMRLDPVEALRDG
ncbi:MAG TPA: ABC transporter permease [Thermoanaerobaculia bacterium]|nr:ABC transporter permease [Thermoanaerobaculia bacterium]